MSLEGLLQEFVRVADATALAVEPAGHDEHLQAIADAAKDLFSAGACSLALVDEDGETLEYRVASGVGADEIVGQTMPVGRGLAGWVVSSGMPLALDDVANDPRFRRDIAESTGYVPKTLLAMPLETDRAVVGVITVLDRELPVNAEAAQRETRLLGLFARQAALALEGAQVFRSAGRLLLEAVSAAAKDSDLAAALEEVHASKRADAARLTELALLLARLGHADRALREATVAALLPLVTFAEQPRAL
ncbi:MAG: GAF domain-containing protein [Actinomycetes bacterium]